jgi:hypothetical protein
MIRTWKPEEYEAGILNQTWGFHSDVNIDDSVGCCAVQNFGCVPAFQRT